MTLLTNASLPWNDADKLSLDHYVNERHQWFVFLLKNAKEQQQIDELNYHRLLMIEPIAETFDEAFALFDFLLGDFIHCSRNYAYFKLLERIQKGAAMIERETDPQKKQRYLELYEKLNQELKGLIA